jgi:putative FmdB family regulatory protein
MPTYEYECLKCPRVFEVRQRITEPALETCDRCGGPIHRLLSAAPFILKGGGWYVTDYPSEARKKGASSDSGSDSSKDSTAKEAKSKESTSKESTSKTSSKDGGSAESKPAASSESKSSTDTGGGSASSTTKTTKSTPAA